MASQLPVPSNFSESEENLDCGRDADSGADARDFDDAMRLIVDEFHTVLCFREKDHDFVG